MREVGHWTIEIRKEVAVVVARGGQETTYETARDVGLAAAQRGLDLFSVLAGEHLAIQGTDNDHLVWWCEPEGTVLRIVSFAWSRVDVPPVRVVVRNAQGNVLPSPPPPPVTWHESFRYFRLSQVTSDLFDAYRNLYLALEALLSTVRPMKLKLNGKPDEKEGEWFLAALNAAGRHVSLATFAPPGSVNPVQDLYEDLYRDTRSALSHAKAGRPVLMPHDHVQRDIVLASLKRLAAFYLALADQVLGARFPRGGATNVAFRAMGEAVGHDMQLWFTDDASTFDPAEKLVNPGGGTLVLVAWQRSPQYDTPNCTTYLGQAAVAALALLPFIARVAASDSSGAALFASVLWGRLEHEGLARMEALIGSRGTNVRQPREDYLT